MNTREREVMVERIAAILYTDATDEPWAVAGVEHDLPDRESYRELARRIVDSILASRAAGEQAEAVNSQHLAAELVRAHAAAGIEVSSHAVLEVVNRFMPIYTRPQPAQGEPFHMSPSAADAVHGIKVGEVLTQAQWDGLCEFMREQDSIIRSFHEQRSCEGAKAVGHIISSYEVAGKGFVHTASFNPHVLLPHGTRLYTDPQLAQGEPESGLHDGYEGAREGLRHWKGRAKRAEARLRNLGWTGADASEPPQSEHEQRSCEGSALGQCLSERDAADILAQFADAAIAAQQRQGGES